MKIKSKSKKLIFRILPIIIIIALVIGGYFLWQYRHNQPVQTDSPIVNQTIDLNPPTTDQKAAGEAQKAANNTPSESTTVHTTITSANANDDLVQIRAIINGAISSTGSCDLTLTNNNMVIAKTSATYALPASSTCQGFDINRSELSVGTWAISLTVTIDTETATATSEVVLE